MTVYTHTLTPVEEACGVTLEQVAEALPRGAFIVGGSKFVTPDLPPALAGSVARAAFGGPVEFAGLNGLGLPVYREA